MKLNTSKILRNLEGLMDGNSLYVFSLRVPSDNSSAVKRRQFSVIAIVKGEENRLKSLHKNHFKKAYPNSTFFFRWLYLYVWLPGGNP